MDMWSDPNLTPYMAVTAHWIEPTTENTPSGPQTKLNMRTDLVGFHRVPGRHTGHHLAHAFIKVLDRLNVTHKVCVVVIFPSYLTWVAQIGWITLDNASNNDTFMSVLERQLQRRRIAFKRHDRRIR
jgi:hypothetical protein